MPTRQVTDAEIASQLDADERFAGINPQFASHHFLVELNHPNIIRWFNANQAD